MSANTVENAPTRLVGVAARTLIGGVCVALLVVAVVAVAAFVTAPVVSGDSMEPTLHNGDRLLMLPGTGGSAQRFQVIVAKYPLDPNEDVVKRVIGLPGDAIEITDTTPSEVLVRPGDKGRWYEVDNPAWRGRWVGPTPCCDAKGEATKAPHVEVVPQGDYFVMGDNVGISIDSRTYGWIKASAIRGHVSRVIWPLAAFGALHDRPTLVPAPPGRR